MDSRKHISQMTIQEETYLKNIYRRVRNPLFTPYSLKRLYQRGIQPTRVIRTIKLGELIEFHVKDNSCRVLIRESRPIHGVVTNVVLELFTKKVITSFKNSADDRHWNLDGSLYNKHLDIIKILRSGENV